MSTWQTALALFLAFLSGTCAMCAVATYLIMINDWRPHVVASVAGLALSVLVAFVPLG